MSRNGPAAARPFAGSTAWARNLRTPLREFLRTETGGAAFLLARDGRDMGELRERRLREQPTPELARSAQARVVTAISPNERLQLLYHP